MSQGVIQKVGCYLLAHRSLDLAPSIVPIEEGDSMKSSVPCRRQAKRPCRCRAEESSSPAADDLCRTPRVAERVLERVCCAEYSKSRDRIVTDLPLIIMTKKTSTARTGIRVQLFWRHHKRSANAFVLPTYKTP